jgi:hypothetical protein
MMVVVVMMVMILVIVVEMMMIHFSDLRGLCLVCHRLQTTWACC